ncbi:MAG TPA: helix-turn-helix transcriptional regulator [Solirubrobacteraceae bacterium]|jgi:transcriptional regulator with XRE-family HTH domain
MSTQEAYRRELAELLGALAGNVRRLRGEKKPECSQEEVAMEANLHRTQWGMIEQGKRDPRFSTMLVVAETLGVTLDELAAGIDAPKERKPSPPTTKRKPTPRA